MPWQAARTSHLQQPLTPLRKLDVYAKHFDYDEALRVGALDQRS